MVKIQCNFADTTKQNKTKWFDLIDMPEFKTENQAKEWLGFNPQYNDDVCLVARIVPVEENGE